MYSGDISYVFRKSCILRIKKDLDTERYKRRITYTCTRDDHTYRWIRTVVVRILTRNFWG